MNVADLVRTIGAPGLVDIALMAALLYTALSWTRKTRASSALTGIVLLGVLYLVARQFGLVLTATIFEQFFAILLIALIVIFQGELRTVFEQVAALGLRRVRRRGVVQRGPDGLSALLARTVFDMARSREGALIVVPGDQPIDPYTSDGIVLDGQISGPLIRSLFDHHSPGHDGALVIHGDRIARFGVHLPLSSNVEARGEGGTRHAAALGITEQTDATCVVVSEERGLVSLARHGELAVLEEEARLFDELEKLAPRRTPTPGRRVQWTSSLLRNWRAKVAAVGVAIAMWIVLVHGAASTYRTLTIPVEVDAAGNPQSQLAAVPAEVRVTLRGPLRSFWMMRESVLLARLSVDGSVQASSFLVTPDALNVPKELVIEQIEPQLVRIEAVERPATESD